MSRAPSPDASVTVTKQRRKVGEEKPRRAPMDGRLDGGIGGAPGTGGGGSIGEAVHKREMIRIHQLWQEAERYGEGIER